MVWVPVGATGGSFGKTWMGAQDFMSPTECGCMLAWPSYLEICKEPAAVILDLVAVGLGAVGLL